MRISDWSSDVCSSDLIAGRNARRGVDRLADRPLRRDRPLGFVGDAGPRGRRRLQEYLPDRQCGLARQERFGIGQVQPGGAMAPGLVRSEEHTSELQSLMRISYAVFCLKKKTNTKQ